MKYLSQELLVVLLVFGATSNVIGFAIGADQATRDQCYHPDNTEAQKVCLIEAREKEARGCVYERIVQVTNIGYLMACEIWRPRWRK